MPLRNLYYVADNGTGCITSKEYALIKTAGEFGVYNMILSSCHNKMVVYGSYPLFECEFDFRNTGKKTIHYMYIPVLYKKIVSDFIIDTSDFFEYSNPHIKTTETHRYFSIDPRTETMPIETSLLINQTNKLIFDDDSFELFVISKLTKNYSRIEKLIELANICG